MRKSFIELVKRPFIGFVCDCEPWMLDNDFILRGYRINFKTCGEITSSIFKIHNETVNIWSHLLGMLLFFVLLLSLFICHPYKLALGKNMIEDFHQE
mmetsp:Transcript_9896/g.13410  ORF Transcript_9896/g.13410 Transcript_9896/m.13410 type:complete len:97 (+) Transcript_9896:259-549(+)